MATPSKDHILREIKRLATENDGVSVGVERFEALTGITQAKWRGRYWARWGDAVREAGYEPGKWQSQVHEDDELLRFLALATRDLGHFPTTSELRMRRKTHPELPDDKVFGNRFGNKAAVVRRVVEYADGHPDLADVAEMCAPLVDQTPAKAKVAPADSVVTGVVYLIRLGEYHKIGKSNDPGRRSYELGLRLPEKHDVEHIIETDDPSGIEAYWHRRFASQRANGEWFRLAPGDLAAFKRRAYM